MHRLTAALDKRKEPLTVFFRDDDAGWGMDALDSMLGVFSRHDLPIDLAVIPAVLTDDVANRLNDWTAQHFGIGLHQHGYAHANHEPDGQRKCEFGPARPVDRQCADIMMGRERLSAMLDAVDPIFTPPWNRCAPETVSRMKAMGYAAYSSDGAVDAGEDAPAMLPISLDWERAQREDSLLDQLAHSFANADAPMGIMLHHAVMTPHSLDTLEGVLQRLLAHPNVQCVPMRRLLEN